MADITSHSGRRSFITNLVAKGVGVFILEGLAAHSCDATTQRCIDVNNEQLRAAVELVEAHGLYLWLKSPGQPHPQAPLAPAPGDERQVSGWSLSPSSPAPSTAQRGRWPLVAAMAYLHPLIGCF